MMEKGASSGLKIVGRLNIQIRSKGGHLLREWTQKNLVVDDGLNIIRDILDPTSGQGGLTHFATGTSTTAVNASQTALVSQIAAGREPVTQYIRTTSKELEVKYFMGSTFGNGNTLGEAGVFDASTGGNMFSRVVLSPTIVKTTAITVTFTWTYNLSAS